MQREQQFQKVLEISNIAENKRNHVSRGQGEEGEVCRSKFYEAVCQKGENSIELFLN